MRSKADDIKRSPEELDDSVRLGRIGELACPGLCLSLLVLRRQIKRLSSFWLYSVQQPTEHENGSNDKGTWIILHPIMTVEFGSSVVLSHCNLLSFSVARLTVTVRTTHVAPMSRWLSLGIMDIFQSIETKPFKVPSFDSRKAIRAADSPMCITCIFPFSPLPFSLLFSLFFSCISCIFYLLYFLYFLYFLHSNVQYSCSI